MLKTPQSEQLVKERVISPVVNSWESFFISDEHPTNDFLSERASQHQPERETF